jgi:type II secretory pathway pseudopilin PulG
VNYSSRNQRGFTIIEATITVVIIAMLAGVLLLAARKAISTTRIEAERRVVGSMKMAVEQFKNDFGFLPPLIDDHIDNSGNPIGNVLDGNGRPDVRDDVFLASEDPGTLDEPRYSIYALQWYLMGALNQTDANGPLDGGAGPKLSTPLRDGTFSRKGKLHDPLYDPSRAGTRNIFGRYPATSAEEARISLTDRWGQPIRYYRWKPQFGGQGGTVSQFLVPRAVGDPANNPALRDAQFAIVSLGPDQRTDSGPMFDRRPLPTSGNVIPAVDPLAADPSVNDNIVEVGR